MDRELYITWDILEMLKITPICGLGVKESCLPYQQTKDVAVIKPSTATIAAPMVSLEGTQDGNKQATCHQAISHLQPPPTVTLRDSGLRKAGYWPPIAKERIKEMISVSPDSCIFPFIEKC